ncbi:MAG: ABC transporter substrate-binding protein [Balneolaceae bacterium]|nr:MAG: ABC transporter substrate-binding protein [Balneolaceae bacterium]
MKKLHHFLFALLPLAILMQACGSTSDTVTVVRDAPRAERAQETPQETVFNEITLGLIDPVTNFDPLFARNLSTQRVLSLIYEGLFKLNNDGQPVPVLAKEVDISDDGLTYTITINRERLYHDSRVFTAGLGRRVHASDVKWAFERTARASVPPRAAELLINVRGFENYFLEQRNVYDIDNRVLNEVRGIQVVNAETVRFQLNEPDNNFLKKLASPNLFIYPREAINNNPDGIAKNPVGTGPYRLNQVEDEGRVILVRHSNNTNDPNLPEINRINAISFTSESDMFQRFASGDIDWIPEAGPEIKFQTLNQDYTLQSAYRDSYNAVVHDAYRINAFYLNNRSVVDQRWLRSRLSLLTPEDFRSRGTIALILDRFETDEEAERREEYFLSFTDDLFATTLLTELHSLVFQPESSLVFFDIRVPTRQTSIFTSASTSFRQQFDTLPEGYWLRIDTKIVSLHNDRVSGIEPTAVPWALNIQHIRVQNGDLSSAR